MEGAAGFGTPIALAAPLVVSIGFTPVVAVALPLIGHIVANSFGALGTPIFAQADVSGLSGSSIAPPTALLHASLAPVLALSIVFIARTGPFRAKHAAWAVFAAVCLLLPYLGLAAFVGPELPALVRALADGKLRAAGLDVLPLEPLIREEAAIFHEAAIADPEDFKALVANNVLLRFPNVIVTPHNAYNTDAALQRLIATTLANIEAFGRGAPQNVVSAH